MRLNTVNEDKIVDMLFRITAKVKILRRMRREEASSKKGTKEQWIKLSKKVKRYKSSARYIIRHLQRLEIMTVPFVHFNNNVDIRDYRKGILLYPELPRTNIHKYRAKWHLQKMEEFTDWRKNYE